MSYKTTYEMNGELMWCDSCLHYERLCGNCEKHRKDNVCHEDNCKGI